MDKNVDEKVKMNFELNRKRWLISTVLKSFQAERRIDAEGALKLLSTPLKEREFDDWVETVVERSRNHFFQ